MSDLSRVSISIFHDTKDHKLILDMDCHSGGDVMTFIRKPLDKQEVLDLIRNLQTLVKGM